MPAQGGEAVQITQNGGPHPRESSDGRSLSYLKPGETGDYTSNFLSTAPVPEGRAGGEESLLLDSIMALGFEIVDQGVYFIPGQGYPTPESQAGTSIQFFDPATRKTRQIAALSRVAWGLSVLPDGESALVVLTEGFESDLILVDNFR